MSIREENWLNTLKRTDARLVANGTHGESSLPNLQRSRVSGSVGESPRSPSRPRVRGTPGHRSNACRPCPRSLPGTGSWGLKDAVSDPDSEIAAALIELLSHVLAGGRKDDARTAPGRRVGRTPVGPAVVRADLRPTSGAEIPGQVDDARTGRTPRLACN